MSQNIKKDLIKKSFKCSSFLFASLSLAHYALKKTGNLPKKNIQNQHIVVTGAGSGIGKLMAIRFAQLGGKISIMDININQAQQTADYITKNQGYSQAFYCDVANPESVKKSFTEARKQFGPISILVNNAGIASSKNFQETSVQEVQRTLNINTLSHFITCKEVCPDMILQKRGHIVCIASAAALVGPSGLTDYTASKMGVFGFNESLRQEFKKSFPFIKTTIACPFFINSPMFPNAKTKFKWLLPILEQEWISNRIVNGVLQNEGFIIEPVFVNFALLGKAFFPVEIYDKLMEGLGINACVGKL